MTYCRSDLDAQCCGKVRADAPVSDIFGDSPDRAVWGSAQCYGVGARGHATVTVFSTGDNSRSTLWPPTGNLRRPLRTLIVLSSGVLTELTDFIADHRPHGRPDC